MGARSHHYRDPVEADAWMLHAACRGMDPALFYPTGTLGAAAQADIAKAKDVCARCPVREPCLELGMAVSVDHGVWGQTSPDDRRELRRQRNLARRRARRAAARSSDPTGEP